MEETVGSVEILSRLNNDPAPLPFLFRMKGE
jgi:hypothetical protein